MKKLPLVFFGLFIAVKALAKMSGTVGYQYDRNVNGSSNRDRLTQETSSRFGGFCEYTARQSGW